MVSFSSIFACGHEMHLGCILANWFDFCRSPPTYGCRPSDSFSCPMCRAGLNLDVTTYSQYWRIRSSFPGPSSESLLRSHYPRVIFPGRIPEIILLRMFARSSPHQMPHDISHLRSQNALRASPTIQSLIHLGTQLSTVSSLGDLCGRHSFDRYHLAYSAPTLGSLLWETSYQNATANPYQT